MPLTERTWASPACRTTRDRDLDAFVNPAQYAVSSKV